MKFLVTGGAGFIGSNIANRLFNDDNEVVVLDDLSLGNEKNIPGIRLVKGDVRDAVMVEEVCRGVDGVFHDAAKSSSPMFSPDPRHGIGVNLMGFMNVMEAARKHDFPVVYASTSSIYSKCKPPHSEDLRVRPGSFYEFSLHSREVAASVYTELYGIRATGLRYFSVYGPHEQHKGKYANNISQFIWDMIGGRTPVIYGDGTQTRDFTHVDDVVEANLLAMKAGFKGEVFNVGTGKVSSFNEMVGLINGALGTSIKPTYVPNPIKNYVQHTKADTKKASRELGFNAKISLKEGIERTVKYYKQNAF